MKHFKFPIYLEKNRIFSNTSKAFSMQDSKNIGEKENNKVIYSEFEALYLLEINQANILKNNKLLTEEQIIKLFSKKQKDFLIKYLVFKALKKKSYIVKTGSKFGAEFRVYDPSSQSSHAKWLVYPVKQNKVSWNEFIGKNRIAHSTGKKLLLAIIDSENNVLFYETSWIKI